MEWIKFVSSRHGAKMAGLLIALVATVAAPSFVRAQSGRWQREAREFGWRLDYRKALAEAKESGRPIMLLFRCVP